MIRRVEEQRTVCIQFKWITVSVTVAPSSLQVAPTVQHDGVRNDIHLQFPCKTLLSRKLGFPYLGEQKRCRKL